MSNLFSVFQKLLNNVEQLAFTQTWLASVKEGQIVGGEYYRGTSIAKTAQIVNNNMLQAKLWDLSQTLIENALHVESSQNMSVE